MQKIHPEAQALNDTIQEAHPIIAKFLSTKGKAIFYPKRGMLKQGAEAKGTKINATIGMALEDDGSPIRLSSIEQMVSLDPEKVFPYASTYGVPDLRSKWKTVIVDKNPSFKGGMSLPVVTGGLTHGLSVAGYLFVNPGDTMVVSSIHWGNYKLIFQNGYGAEFNTFNTFSGEGYDIDSFKNTLLSNPGKQIVLLNFPNNPTGYTLTEDEASRITDVIVESAEAGNHILVILDDAYFGLVYKEGVYKESLFGKLADLHENIFAVKVDGATKEDYAWGFRVGFVTFGSKGCCSNGYTALEDKVAGAVRRSISSSSHISQSLLLSALSSDSYKVDKKQKYDMLKTRFNTVIRVMEENEEKFQEYFTPLPFNSGYFMCLKLVKDIDAEQIRYKLLTEYNTGIISLPNLIRLAYASVAERDIPTLFENLYEVCKQLEGK